MTEPDFDQIARQLVGVTIPTMDDAAAQRIMATVEQLRQVWNARGGADKEAILELLPYSSDIGDRAFENGMNDGIGEALDAIKALDR